MMKRMISLLLVLIMVLGLVPLQVNAEQQRNDVFYVDENTSLEELEAMGLVQTGSSNQKETISLPSTPTAQTVKTEVPELNQPYALSTLCNCGRENADLYHHSDNCPLRLYYLQVCADTSEKIYDLWSNVGLTNREFLEDYLSANYPDKLSEVLKLRDAEAIVDDSQQFDEAEKERLSGEASVTVDGVTVDALGVPEGSSLTVQQPTADSMELVEEIVAAAEDEPEQVFLYDISVQNDQSSDWQPEDTSVQMTLTIPTLDLAQYTEVRIIHVDDEGNHSMITGQVDADGHIVFETGGFSTFAGFTVEFTFGSAMVSIPGKTSTTMNTLFQELKMPLRGSDVVDVQFTNYDLLTVTQEENDWRLTSLEPFSTHETLTFTMADGATYEFMVTDAQYAQVSLGNSGNGPWETDENGYVRWFADGDGELVTSGTITDNFRSYYWAQNAIVYIKGPGVFTIAIQPNGGRPKTDKKLYVKMKQVRVMGGADVEFYIGTHFIAPHTEESKLYGASATPWSSMQEIVVKATDTKQSLFYVENGRLTLEGRYQYNATTKQYQTINLVLEGNVTQNTTTQSAEPLVNLREGCNGFIANRVVFTNCASGGIFSQAENMKLFQIKNCEFQSSVFRDQIYSNNKWVSMNGGAIYFNEGDDGAEKIVDYVYMENCTFNGSKAGSYGGAVYMGDRIRMVLIKGCKFMNCTSGGSGGAIAVRATIGQFHVSDATFTDCTAKKDGGAISLETVAINSETNYNRIHEIRLAGSTFTRCKATAEHSNTSDGIGGGVHIAIQCNTVNISACTFDACEAKGNATNLAGGGLAFGYYNIGDTGMDPNGSMDKPWTEDLQYHKRDGGGFLLDAAGNRIMGDHDDDSSTAAAAITEARHDTQNLRVLFGGEGTYRDSYQGWLMENSTDPSQNFYRQRISYGDINISGTTFMNAKNTYQGGGFQVRTGTTIEAMNVTDCIFDNNQVADKGSSVFFNNCIVGTCNFTDCTFKNCEVQQSYYTGGGTIRTVGQTSTVMTVKNCKFLDNKANLAGGGIYWNAGKTVQTPDQRRDGITPGETAITVEGCEFRRNSALANENYIDYSEDDAGNPIPYVDSNGKAKRYPRFGGAIFCETKMTVSNCIFDGNESEIGGALCMGVYNSNYRKFADNEITQLKLDSQTEFFNNVAKNGGAIAIRANPTMAIDNGVNIKHTIDFTLGGAKVYNNVAKENGGGIYYIAETSSDPLEVIEVNNYIKTITIDNGTIYGNTAGNHGGGIYMQSDSNTSIDVIGGTIYENAAGLTRTVTITDQKDANGNNIITMDAGTVTGGDGGGIFLDSKSATFNIQGGYIGAKLVDGNPQAAGNKAYYSSGKGKTGSGNGGGITILGGAEITMTGGYIGHNEADTDGGGLRLTRPNTTEYPTVTMTIYGGSILSNSANDDGGAIYTSGTNATINLYDGTIYGNSSAVRGGGIYLSGGTCVNVYGGTFSSNTAGTYGGGICLSSNTVMQASGGTIQNNTAKNGGGIALSSTNSSLTMEPRIVTEEGKEPVTVFALIDSNHATANGGGIYVSSSSHMSLSGGTVSNNASGGSGGGIYVTGSMGTSGSSEVATRYGMYVSGGLLQNNTAAEAGGGIAISGSTMYFENGEIINNQAVYGGGISVVSSGDRSTVTTQDPVWGMMLVNGTISNNLASTLGGGICVSTNSTMKINGGEVSQNKTASDWSSTEFTEGQEGGGIAVCQNSTMLISGGTISDNGAYNGGGIAVRGASAVTMDKGTTGDQQGCVTDNTAVRYGGGIYIADAQDGNSANKNGFTIYDGQITNNVVTCVFATAPDYFGGGGVYAGEWAVFLFDGGLIAHNEAQNQGWGGGVFCHRADLDILDGTIEHNSACNGGGIAVRRLYMNANIEGGKITNNTAINDGGGIYTYTQVDLLIKGGEISENTAQNGSGGGVYVYNHTKMSVSGDCVIKSNHANAGSGGGIYTFISVVSVSGGEISENTAYNGGGIAAFAKSDYDQHFIIEGGIIEKNSATANGGGVYAANYAMIDILANEESGTHGEINKNTASNGGGIYVTAGAGLVVNNGYVTNNTAVSPADAVEISTGYWGLVGDELHGSGGGVCVTNGGSAANSTFTLTGDSMAIYGNQATFSGDDVFSNGHLTQLTVPTVVDMDLAGYDFTPEGWFEDYNTGDEYYYSGLKMIPANGGGDVTQNPDGTYQEVHRYRNTDGLFRRYVHIRPVYVLGELKNDQGVVTEAVPSGAVYVNKLNAYVAMTLGIPTAVEDTVVIDYGNKVTINVWQNDLFMDQADFAETAGVTTSSRHNSFIGKSMPDYVQYKDGVYYSMTRGSFGKDYDMYENYFQTDMHGKITNGKNGTVTFEPNTFSLDQVDKFYYMVRHKSVWYYANVTVVPATSVYFEDNLKKNSTLQVKYHTTSEYEKLASWEELTDGIQDATQEQDRPGFTTLNGLDAENVYGYDGNFSTTTGYSSGTAHHVKATRHLGVDKNGDQLCDECGVAIQLTHEYVAKNAKGQCKTCLNLPQQHGSDVPEHICSESSTYNEYCDYCGKWIGTHTTNARATFTFTGTGFDLVSLCSANTGVVMVSVYKGTVTDFDNPPWDDYVTSFMVDTYYGYTINPETGKWEQTEKSDTILYQVPSIKVDLSRIEMSKWNPDTNDYDLWYEDFGYGTYSVEIYIATSFLEREHGYWETDFYLDGIRVYNPVGIGGSNSQEAYDAYIADGENWPVYAELRNMFITQKELGINTTNGIIFIDGKTTPSIEEYKTWGPNNEVYLNPGESVAFTLNASNYAMSVGNNSELSSDIVAGIHLGMRGLTGLGKVTIYDGQNVFNTIDMGTTDMYYDITSLMNKVVTITNKGSTPIALSNVKITHKYAPVVTGKMGGEMFTMNQDASKIALSVFTPEQLTDPVLQPKYPALSFEGMVSYNVFFTAEELGNLNGADLGLAVFDSYQPEGTVETAKDVILGATQIDGLYMVATNGVHAKCLGDTQYFRTFAKKADGTYVYSKMVSYSALDYAKNTLAKSGDVKLKQLVVAMLNYGAEAQKFFGYNTDDLMNKDLTADQQALVSGIDASSLNPVGKVDASKVGVFASNGGFAKKYPAISFKGAFEINYFMAPSNAVDNGMRLYIWNEDTYNNVDELTVSNTDKIVTMTLENGLYTASSDQIAAKDLDETVYVAAVYESDGKIYSSGVLPYSIAAYCRKPAADVAALANAAAVYGAAAKEFFSE